MKTGKKANVIDLNQRLQAAESSQRMSERMRNLKLRFDLENAKVALSTSLVSIVALVTIANSQLMSPRNQSAVAFTSENVSRRGIASVPTGTSDEEDEMVGHLHRLHKMSLSERSVLGQRPSALDRFSLEFFEGRYAVLVQDGKVFGLEFPGTQSSTDEGAKVIEDRAAFIESHRELLPMAFKTFEKVESTTDVAHGHVETYRFFDGSRRTVGKVSFRLSDSDRLLSMRVASPRFVSK